MLLKDKHIFIAEDNPQNRLVFKMVLLTHGANIEFERWGQDTLWRLDMCPHTDLIILDLMLRQGISGYDLFKQIRALPKFGCIPIIAVSAADPSTAIPKAQEMGFAGFIGKPIDDDLFPQQIAKILGGEKIWFAG